MAEHQQAAALTRHAVAHHVANLLQVLVSQVPRQLPVKEAACGQQALRLAGGEACPCCGAICMLGGAVKR